MTISFAQNEKPLRVTETADHDHSLARRFAGVLIAALIAAPAYAANFEVNDAGDAGDNTCDATCTLRDAIVEANATTGTDTITFDADALGIDPVVPTAATITLTSNLVTVTDSLVVMGPGASLLAIDGANSYSIFTINDGTSTVKRVTLKGLTLTQGSGGSTGGAVDNSGERVTIEDCVISDSTATSGGGIYTTGAGSRLIVRNTTLSGNSATSAGGGIHVGTTNADGIQGVLIEKSTIGPGNTAGTDGGGIYLSTPASPVLIDKSTVADNTATANGGGLYIGSPGSNAIVTVRSTTISGNTANSTTNDTGGGGGVYVNTPATLVTIENCTISGNTATNENGGGLLVFDVDNDDVNARALLTRLRNTSVVDNHAPDTNNTNGSSGGGIYALTDVILQNVIVADNTGDISNNPNDDDVNNDSGDDEFFSEFSLFEDPDASIVDLPGGGNIQGPLAFPGLSPLQNNGGGRQTHALKVEALETGIDRGGNSACLTPHVRNIDGRGARRPIDGNEDLTATCDIGAYEYNGRVQVCPSTPMAGCTVFSGGGLTIGKGAKTTANKLDLTFTGADLEANPEFFGDPTQFLGTANAFCVYADVNNTNTQELAAQAIIEAGEIDPKNKLLWKTKITDTLSSNTYSNSVGNPDGVRKAAQKTGTSASIKATASGASAPLPVLPLDTSAGVTIQNILSNGNCAEVSFDSSLFTSSNNTAAKVAVKK